MKVIFEKKRTKVEHAKGKVTKKITEIKVSSDVQQLTLLGSIAVLVSVLASTVIKSSGLLTGLFG